MFRRLKVGLVLAPFLGWARSQFDILMGIVHERGQASSLLDIGSGKIGGVFLVVVWEGQPRGGTAQR